MILERFDTIVFIGDNTVRNIHSGFNILLRENQMLGAITEWDMNDAELYLPTSRLLPIDISNQPL